MAMHRLLHRLSVRRRPRPRSATLEMRGPPASCPELTYCGPTYCKQQALLDLVLCRTLNYMDDLFALVHIRLVNKACKAAVDGRLEQVVKMQVRRVDFSDPCSELAGGCDSVVNLNNNSTPTNGLWYLHPAGHRLAVKLLGNSVEILVDERWTSKEVNVLCDLLSLFRPSVTHVSLDAPIVELVIASLSLLDLDRWYAFQCFLQAINDPRVRLNIQQLPVLSQREEHQHYWPNVEDLVIRTTEKDSVHLARLLDYGVRSHCVVNRCRLLKLQVQVQGATKTNRALNRNLYHFRCWAGSAGFDDRFSQCFETDDV